jgi:Rne/Rng family ribonuclease
VTDDESATRTRVRVRGRRGTRPADEQTDTESATRTRRAQPKDDQPEDEQPQAERRKRERLKRGQPKDEQPKDEQPKDEQPKDEQPKDEQPKTEQPKGRQAKREQPDAAGPADETTSSAAIVRRRRRRPTVKRNATDDAPAATEDGADTPDVAESDATLDDVGGDERRPARRGRRRGGRGRGRRAGNSAVVSDESVEAPAPPEGPDTDTETDADVLATEVDERADDDAAQGVATRLQARGRRARGPRTAGALRRPLGGVSEETRRAITEGPPRRMLVSEGAERTQIAVLEERTLVEHYVTRKSDVSYVGNIYLGRVQNVLPGMEAAFVDIGKGRNGVLYAGEVNYDEADLDGELPRIEQTLKPGQSVLVQVTKDPMGTKGARLTQHLSVAGRYCVLAPGDGMLGISRKLTDEERERLRRILKTVKPEGYGLIVRTAAEGATQEQLEADVARLVRIWEQVEARAAKAKVLEPVYEEPNLVIRVIRDVFGPEYTDLIVDSEELGAKIRDYLGDVSPELVDKISVYAGEDALFDSYEVTNQIRRALEKKVWLASGGYLIIEKTEAMWVIDVNTGKFVGERNLEETVLRNNLEAATEIARQLRLRDMGGIIVIDFVDMLVPANRDEVLKRFKRELARDKTKSRVMEISKLGLVQMTRKNVSQGVQESFTTRCEVCEGRGATMVSDVLA